MLKAPGLGSKHSSENAWGLTVHMLRVYNSIQSGHLENPYVSRLPVHHGVKSWSRGIHQQLPNATHGLCTTLLIPPCAPWSSLLWFTLTCLRAHSCPSLVTWPPSLAPSRLSLWLPSPQLLMPPLLSFTCFCALRARQPAWRQLC